MARGLLAVNERQRTATNTAYGNLDKHKNKTTHITMSGFILKGL